MVYVIQAPNGEYLHPDIYRMRYVADHGGIRTEGPFWTKDINEAKTFDTWFQAEALAGILFWDRHSSDINFKYQDTIKARAELGGN